MSNGGSVSAPRNEACLFRRWELIGQEAQTTLASDASTVPRQEPLRWYGVQVRPRCEVRSAAALDNRGYESFLPIGMIRRRWSDRIKETRVPLIPGYVFCRLDIQRRLGVLTSPGVVCIVGSGKAPLPIEEREISLLRALVASGLDAQPCPYLGEGSRVEIDRGPLRGVVGVIARLSGRQRLVVSIPLLQRSLAVELERDCIRSIQ